MKKIIFAVIALIFFNEYSSSQFIKNYGLTGGFVFFSQHTYSPEFGNNTGYGYDIGVFIECPVYKKLTSVFEIHFSDKGIDKGDPVITSPIPFGYSNFVDISNRYQYLTLQTLAKYKFTKINYGFYGEFGFRIDILLRNYYTGYNENYTKPSNGHIEWGATIGIGYIFRFHLLLDAQFNPNITDMYKYTLNGYNITFRNSSFLLSFGYGFK